MSIAECRLPPLTCSSGRITLPRSCRWLNFRGERYIVSLPSAERTERVKEGDDLCALWASSDAERHRYFVRCGLKVSLLDAEGQTAWGLWAEVSEADFRRIVETWSDPEQASFPPMAALLANRVPDYPETVGLLQIPTEAEHPFRMNSNGYSEGRRTPIPTKPNTWKREIWAQGRW